MPVRTERQDYVTTVVLSRVEARNAVDGPTGAELVQAFREFDADESARVAVPWGAGGTFCAGADLKALVSEQGSRVAEDGPMGPTRLRLSKPVISAVAPRHACAATAPPSWTRKAWSRPRRCVVNSVTAQACWPRAWRAPTASRQERTGTARSVSPALSDELRPREGCGPDLATPGDGHAR